MLDASGDQVGKVRDVVVQNRTNARSPRVKGLVVELLRLRKVFLPMERVHAIDAQQVIIQGVVNTVAFQRREAEALVYEDLFDKKIDRPGERPASIFDLSIVQTRTRAWEVDEVALTARVAIVLAALAAQPTAPRAVRSARRAAADAALARVGL